MASAPPPSALQEASAVMQMVQMLRGQVPGTQTHEEANTLTNKITQMENQVEQLLKKAILAGEIPSGSQQSPDQVMQQAQQMPPPQMRPPGPVAQVAPPQQTIEGMLNAPFGG